MPDDAKTDAEKAADEKAATEAEAKKSEGETSGGVEFDGEFDAARAKKAIEAARAEAKKLKSKLERQGGKLDKFEKAEADKAEADKDNEQKLVDRDAEIVALKSAAESREVKSDFIDEAEKRGYTNPKLAYLAAVEQGLLGKYTPKTGAVGDHDFAALEESHDLFATEAGRTGDQATGDAGARGGGTTTGVAGAFNRAVRKQIAGR
jgi:hypothetical protein